MSKKDFELIASVLSEALADSLRAGGDNYDEDSNEYIATRFADVLGQTNPRFNRERFLRACGVSA